MKFRNISSQGELEVPDLERIVAYEEVIEITPEEAERLAGQVTVWEAVDAEAQAVHDKVLAEEAAANAAAIAGNQPAEPVVPAKPKTSKKPRTAKPQAVTAPPAPTTDPANSASIQEDDK